MSRSPYQPGIRWLGLGLAAAPLALGAVRAFQQGNDLRMLAMAFASLLGVALVRTVGRSRSQRPIVVFAVATLAVTAALAAGVAFVLGATAAPGIWAIAVVFALLHTVSFVLGQLSRPGVDLGTQ